MSYKFVPLEQLCEVLDSKRKPITKRDRTEGIYPYYGATGIVDYIGEYIFDEKLVLIGEDGAKWGEGDKTAFIAEGQYWVNNHAHVIKPLRNLLLDEWLVYYFWFKDLSEYVTGLTVPKLNQGQLKTIPIPLPSLATQQKLVEKLDAIFAEIDRATVATEANVKNAEALFQSYLTEVFERGGEGWSKTKLKDIAEYFNGLTYTPKDVSDEGTVVLRSSNVQQDKIELDDIVRVSSPIKEKLYVRNGDILMCSRNGSQRLVGKTATIGNLDERMTFGTFMMVIRGDSNFFIEWFFKSSLFKRQIVTGENTMINQITRYMLDDVVIPIPDIDTQKFISEKIFNLYKTSSSVKKTYQNKLIELDLYKKSILKQAFNGELVKE